MSVSNDFMEFICGIYAEAFAGSVLERVDHPENYDRQKIMKYTSIIICSVIPNALQAAANLTD